MAVNGGLELHLFRQRTAIMSLVPSGFSPGFWFVVLVIALISSVDCRDNSGSSLAPEAVRVAGGSGRCSGVVEIKHHGEWRPLNIKDKHNRDNLKLAFAAVTCRQIDCGSLRAIDSKTNRAGPAWELNFYCLGSEASLKECDKMVTRSRVHSQDSSISSLVIVCAESVRLEPPHVDCSGRVKVRSGQDWLPVCEEGLTSFAQNLICRELGCGPADSSRTTTEQSNDSVLAQEFSCPNNESRLEDCASSTRSNCSLISRIQCYSADVQLRLNGGESSCRGTLEGLQQREWMSLTDSFIFYEPLHRHHVCHTLGCGDAISAVSTFLPTSQPMWRMMQQCYHSTQLKSLCSPWRQYVTRNGINLTCAESVRLKSRDSRCLGEVLVKSGNTWLPACSNYFSHEDAHVVCRDLGCGFLDSHRSHQGSNKQEAMLWTPELRCEGTELSLAQCPSSALNASLTQLRECESVYLKCSGVPPAPRFSLRTIQQHDHVLMGQRFAIICTNEYPGVRSFRLSFKENNTILQTVPANGNGEGVFLFPAEAAAGENTFKCEYIYDFSPEQFSVAAWIRVKAEDLPDVRLVGEEFHCLGRLEVQKDGEWRPVSHQQSWTRKEADMVCRQLGCGSVAITRKVDLRPQLQPVWRFFSDCQGSELSLMDCGAVEKWVASSGVEVICSDILLQPNITFYSGLGVEQQEDSWVFRHHSFKLRCSTQPQYPHGHFSLVFIGANQTQTFIQPAVNHTAIFMFSKADLRHQGNYTCVYHNSIFSQTFSSTQSKNFFLTVRDANSLWLYNEDQEVEGVEPVCAGQLMMGHPKPMPLSVDSTVWDMKHADIVCRQLGCGPPVSTGAVALTNLTSVWRFFSDCDGSEIVLMDCGATRQWFSSSGVEVVCNDGF